MKVNNIKILMTGIFVFLGLSQSGYCKVKDSVEMPDTIRVGTHVLTLNGMGTRKATIFKVKVYTAGLYLESSSSNPTDILNSEQLKRVEMHFVHDAPADKIRKAWNDSYSVNCKVDCEALKPALEELNASMVDMKPGDRMTFTFYPDSLEVQVKGNPSFRLGNKEFQKVVLASWLGAEPPNQELKEGLLGK